MSPEKGPSQKEIHLNQTRIFRGTKITSKMGDMIQLDEHIFQMGWFNHQVPASSKWPFDTPNGGHLTLEKVT